MKRQIPWETELIKKIEDVINYCFPNVKEKALKQFKKEKAKEIPLMQTKVDFARGFEAWFLLKYLIEETFTPMEFISGNPANYFTKRELQMVDNFLNNKEGFYELISISKDKKDFIIKNVANEKIITVKTIDFPAKLEAGEYIQAIPVQKLDSDHFFYGNVACYSKENGEAIKKVFLEELKKQELDEKNLLKKRKQKEYDIRVKLSDNPKNRELKIKEINKNGK